ncbi:MAG: transglutaminase-like domain-containing protein [Candidatus Hinthialibacter antarcticus]|nr:transglutaminase-like domain-containing protein [Candidatus Hinthialibacter antarcticus]
MFKSRLTWIAIAFFALAIFLLRQDISYDSFLKRDARIDLTDGALVMRQQYLGFYLGGKKIGYSRFVLKESGPELPDPESLGLTQEDVNQNTEAYQKAMVKASSQTVDYYTFQSDSLWEIQAMGIPFEIKVENAGTVFKDLSMRTFRFVFQSSGQSIRIEGEVKKHDDGSAVLTLVTHSEGSAVEKKVDLSGPVYSTDTVHLLAARDGLKTGANYIYPVYDPLTMSLSEISVSVEGEDEIELKDGKKQSAFKLIQDYKGFKATSWVDQDGEVYQENSQVSGIPFTALRESAEEAVDADYKAPSFMPEPTPSSDSLDLIDNSRVLTNVRFRDPSAVDEMETLITGKELDDIPSDGYFQTIIERNDDSIKVKAQRLDYETVVPALPQQAPPYAETDDALKPFLEDDALIQVSNPRIKEKALEITSSAENAWDASEKIAKWLYLNLEKEFRVTIPSALEVLNSMKGDCNEHSTLFTALARSIGIPTKIVAGLVYQDDGFYYHAWNEIYASGHWLPIDSTLYRFRMDAAHIKLAEGALDSQSNIAKLVGNLSIEVVDYKEQ